MERRNFIKGAASVVLPLTLNGYTARALGLTPMVEKLGEIATATDRILVLIQLAGGNDGINTVLSLDQYSAYMAARANVAIPENRILKLTDKTGLHPAMTGLKSLYDAGKLAVLQGVTYPSPNQSHFRSTDIWMTGSSYNTYMTTGWAARYLDSQFPGYPAGYPSSSMPDPLAIQIGAVPSVLFREDSGPMGVNLQNPDDFYRLVSGLKSPNEDPLPDTLAGRQIAYIRQIQSQSQGYATVIKSAADKAKNVATYPARGTNTLADQLAIVARLIAGGLKTRLYLVSIGGFDTHAAQVNATDKTIGTHATLLTRLSDAIAAFQNDLKALNAENKVLGMTFSEFGRRVASNVANGTDHGTAAPQFVFGSMVKGGVVGTNPSLTDLTNGNLRMQYDFRDIYASVLKQWFLVNDKEYGNVFSRDFTQIPLIQGATTDVVVSQSPTASVFAMHNYPNPCSVTTTIEYTLPAASFTRLIITDMQGRQVATTREEIQTAGIYSIQINVEHLTAGAYMCRLQTERGIASSHIVVSR